MLLDFIETNLHGMQLICMYILCYDYFIWMNLEMLHSVVTVFYSSIYFFLVEENGVTWLWSLKTTTVFVHGAYFDPMTPPLGVLKSQSRTSTHLGSFPSRVPTVLQL